MEWVKEIDTPYLLVTNVKLFSTFMEGNLVKYMRDTRIFTIISQIIQILEVSS